MNGSLMVSRDGTMAAWGGNRYRFAADDTNAGCRDCALRLTRCPDTEYGHCVPKTRLDRRNGHWEACPEPESGRAPAPAQRPVP